MITPQQELKPAPLDTPGRGNFLLPHWATIIKKIPEAEGISTFHVKLIDLDFQARYQFWPGQFNMLYVPGFGEAAISMSSEMERDKEIIVHTVRHVGNVTNGLSNLNKGDAIGIRGPFGTAWPLDQLHNMDLVIACGGIGLPPLRGAIYHILRQRSAFGKVTLLYGARTPSDLLYREEYETWKNGGIDVQVTVDRGDLSWDGRVGVVPMWFYHLKVEPRKTAILTCGPEIMIRFVIYEALARRIPTDQIFISLERNMKCGLGICGHCQQGPYFICKDGPVFTYRSLESIFNIEEY